MSAERTYVSRDERKETEACQAGTVGCSIDHDADHGSCETW
jgi:hypothetical protein